VVGEQSETAIADFEQAPRLVGRESDGASSLFGIGTAHWCHREYDASMTWVERAAVRRPNAPGLLAQLAGCHIRLGNPMRGRAILDEMMHVRPEVTAGHISGSFWFDKPCPPRQSPCQGCGHDTGNLGRQESRPQRITSSPTDKRYLSRLTFTAKSVLLASPNVWRGARQSALGALPMTGVA
jgi:hypothetical protein